jgi:hypothetical protein
MINPPMSYDERQSRKVIIDTPSHVAVALDYMKNLWNGLAGMNLQPSVLNFAATQN